MAHPLHVRMLKEDVEGNMPNNPGALLLSLCLLSGGSAQAASLPAPAGEVILEVTGDIDHTNRADAAHFDLAMLEELEQYEIDTTTDWTEGRDLFEGPRVRSVLSSVGAGGEAIIAVALNDYSVEIPMRDVHDYNVILALKRNGEYMSIRDKGPIWIVYPRDDYEELQTIKANAKWIWQLRRIHIE